MRRVLGPLAFLASSVLFAQATDIPLANWTVPPYISSSTGGYTTMVDQTPPRPFIGMQPCRLLDTRNNLNPLGGGGIFAANEIRTYTLPPHCGLPSEVSAASLNMTATDTGANPFGHLKVWPADQAEPNVSTLNWTVGGQTVANAAIVPLGSGGVLKVKSGNAGSHVIIDINGYFSSQLGNPDNTFIVTNNRPFGVTAAFQNFATTGPARALAGISSSSDYGASGVYGSVGGAGFGNSIPPAGVRGESPLYGVVGVSTTAGVSGVLVSGGVVIREAFLGWTDGAESNYGVWSFGGYGGTGAKFFVEPHPSDASKVIRYIALEGPEPGTYFRGRGKVQRGVAQISVPDDFRMVTDEEGLTVQITPIGPMATFSVLKADLNEIVVQASRNVEFYYMVNGIRRTHKHLTSPIADGSEFMPRSADSKMPEYFSEEQKRLLVQNGTYKEDGTVNMETARRVGWDRVWEERARPTPVESPN